MTKEKLEEIRSNIDLLMIAERNCGHRNEYSPSLKQRIELYNEVIRLDEAIETEYYKEYGDKYKLKELCLSNCTWEKSLVVLGQLLELEKYIEELQKLKKDSD